MLHTAVTCGVEVLRQLHRCSADGSGCAVDEDAASLAKICRPQAAQRRHRSVADRRGPFEARAGRLVRQQATPHADELRVAAETFGEVGPDAEDVVTDLELADGYADCLDLSRELAAEDPLLRPEKTCEEAPQERLGAADVAVRPVDRRRVDPDEKLVVLRVQVARLLLAAEPPAGRSGRAQLPSCGGHSLCRADRQDDVSRLLPGLDVPRRLDHVLQRVTAVDDRPVFPASMSSLRKSTSAFVYLAIPSVTRLSPIHRVDKARSGTCHMNPRSVSM